MPGTATGSASAAAAAPAYTSRDILREVWTVAEELAAVERPAEACACLEAILLPSPPPLDGRQPLQMDTADHLATRVRLAELYLRCSPTGNTEKVEGHLKAVAGAAPASQHGLRAFALLAQSAAAVGNGEQSMWLKAGLDACTPEEKYWQPYFAGELSKLGRVEDGGEKTAETELRVLMGKVGSLIHSFVGLIRAGEVDLADEMRQDLVQCVEEVHDADVKTLLTLYLHVCKALVCDIRKDHQEMDAVLQLVLELDVTDDVLAVRLPFRWLGESVKGVLGLLRAHALLVKGDAKASLAHSLTGDKALSAALPNIPAEELEVVYKLKFTVLQHVFGAYLALHYPAYAASSLFALRECSQRTGDARWVELYRYMAAQYCALAGLPKVATQHLGTLIENAAAETEALPLFYAQLALLHYSAGKTSYEKVKVICGIVGDMEGADARACDRFLSGLMFLSDGQHQEAVRCAQQCIEACSANPERHYLALLATQLLAHISPGFDLPAEVVDEVLTSVLSVCAKSQDVGMRIAMLRTLYCIYYSRKDEEKTKKSLAKLRRVVAHQKKRVECDEQRLDRNHHASALSCDI